MKWYSAEWNSIPSDRISLYRVSTGIQWDSLENMTKEELANELYMQRPSLSRELIKMKQDGLIEYDRYSITILKDVRGE